MLTFFAAGVQLVLKIANQATKITRVETEYGNIMSLIAARIRPDDVRIKFIDAYADKSVGGVWPRRDTQSSCTVPSRFPPSKAFTRSTF